MRLGKLPDADMIIHCGDFTSVGHGHEIRNFMKWYSGLNQYSHKIIIAGNHDRLFETNRILALEDVPKNVIYLEDSGIEIEGIKFYGSPVQLPFLNWAFNRPEEKLIEHWQAIPDNTDVLITHSPPYGIMDFGKYTNHHAGSPSLYFEVVQRIKPKIHCFGHIHSDYGIKIIENTTFINASNLNDNYIYVNNPISIEI
jgi:Icc-related predicted phosphoesterase